MEQKSYLKTCTNMRELIELRIIESVAMDYIPDKDMRNNFINTLVTRQGFSSAPVPTEAFEEMAAKKNDSGRPMTEEESHKALQPITEGIIADIPLPIYLMPERPYAKLPEYKSEFAAAMDMYAAEGISILPGAIGIVSTGLKIEVPINWKLEIYSRSGMAANGIFVANQPGKIDPDYRGEVKILLYNSTQDVVIITTGDRVAQCELIPYHKVSCIKKDKLSGTVRGVGGFGHTGK